MNRLEINKIISEKYLPKIADVARFNQNCASFDRGQHYFRNYHGYSFIQINKVRYWAIRMYDFAWNVSNSGAATQGMPITNFCRLTLL